MKMKHAKATKPKKVALVYDAIYPFVKGGGERRFYELGRHLAERGYDVHLYGMKLWDGPKVIKYEGMTLHGISKKRDFYDANGKRHTRQALFFGLACFKLLFEDFDVLDCCGFPYFSLFPARLAATLKRKPLFATWHEVWGLKYWQGYIGKPLGYVGFLVEWLAARLPHRIIANSELTAERLRTELHAKTPVAIVPNGIDVQSIFELEPATDASDIVYVGRLMTNKNLQLLIEALAVLKSRGRNLRCTVIGDGPERNRWKRLAKKLGVEKQIAWLGIVEKSDDVYRHMKASRVFVLPSDREGFGIVALEANACGIPVLTLDHPENATRDLIRPGKNGNLFERSAEGLAEDITKTIAAGKETWHDGCAEVARDFDWTHLTTNLAEAYGI
jgi:glycosyltransferase involved in cell wall biosynthesis